MFRITYSLEGDFTVTAGGKQLVVEEYGDPAFFVYEGKQYVAFSNFWSPRIKEGVYLVSSQPTVTFDPFSLFK